MSESSDMVLLGVWEEHRARIARRASIGLARIERLIGRIGLARSEAVRRLGTTLLLLSLVVLATAADRGVFFFLGLGETATTLVAFGANASIAVVAHHAGSRLYALAHLSVLESTGSHRHAQAALVTVAAIVCIGSVFAIAWARAAQVAAETGSLFPGSIGFAGGLILFLSIGFALLVVAALVSYHRAEVAARHAGESGDPTPTQRERARVVSACRRLLHRLEALCHRANSKLAKLAARLISEGEAPREVPVVEVPHQVRSHLEATILRFAPQEGGPDVERAA